MAKRLPKSRSRVDSIAEALTFDRAVRTSGSEAAHVRVEAGQLQPDEWNKRFADLLERVMATAAANGDPRPLQKELEELMAEKPPEKKDDAKS